MSFRLVGIGALSAFQTCLLCLGIQSLVFATGRFKGAPINSKPDAPKPDLGTSSRTMGTGFSIGAGAWGTWFGSRFSRMKGFRAFRV